MRQFHEANYHRFDDHNQMADGRHSPSLALHHPLGPIIATFRGSNCRCSTFPLLQQLPSLPNYLKTAIRQ